MPYVEYNYGCNRKEIKKLLRKRLMIKERIRYHKGKASKWAESLPEIEKRIDCLLGERQKL